ncbi:uncharacterized protein LOC116504347 [Thamnophis elegans]|uniref:uncharacterized protein LOC116504347 n=1 Tax=Thamnophis elegans TaxID=35005 RepID=UPI001376DFDE|nr:uncharacterized protein LOC116504347 [Thamnophis elegans]
MPVLSPQGGENPVWTPDCHTPPILFLMPYTEGVDEKTGYSKDKLDSARKNLINQLGEEEQVKQFPLRETPNGVNAQGAPIITYVHEPLRATEVRAFKKEMKNFIEDPLTASDQLDSLLGPNIYTWEEIQNIMGILFSPEERNLIRVAAMAVWERENPVVAGGNQDRGDTKYPLVKPNWNNNEAEGRRNMQDLRSIIIKGMREAIPRTQNMAKAMDIEQGKEEAPATFLQRLKDGMRKYAGADPDDALNVQIVKIQFVTKAWPDIARKLQKRENWATESLEVLLKEAQKIYVNREEEKVKKLNTGVVK